VGAVGLLVRDQVEEPLRGLLLAGEGDGREDCGSEPGVACLSETGAQQLEAFVRVSLGYRHGGFGGGIVLGWEELCDPGDGSRTFDCEDAGVAGPEEFRGVGGKLGPKAKEERRGVGAYLLDGADNVDPDRQFFVSEVSR
jgi:hypothetical protein